MSQSLSLIFQVQNFFESSKPFSKRTDCEKWINTNLTEQLLSFVKQIFIRNRRKRYKKN